VVEFSEIRERLRFWRDADRLGPDIPLTHWRLHFKSSMRALCERKFKHFADGAEFRPGAYAVCCSAISIGRRVVIRPGSQLMAVADGAITIEDDVLLGSGVHIYVSEHCFDDANVPIIDQGHYPPVAVLLKRGCWIGANTVILPGVTIGENAIIGAGSVVTRSIPEKVMAAGCPARVVRQIGSAARSP
jgi:acetyltransferase-like isoleucine patch superfamily enzyme